jgi:hypothetical protein
MTDGACNVMMTVRELDARAQAKTKAENDIREEQELLR